MINTEISAVTLREVIHVVAYFSADFMKVFCAPPKYIIDADNLTLWLNSYRNVSIRYLKLNSILQRGPNAVRKKNDLNLALDVIIQRGEVSLLKAGRTTVVDLFPSYLFDQYKLSQDLALLVTL